MEKIKSLLKIETIVSKPDIDGELRNIANILMNEYCISNGEYIYRPIEIEFYVYDKDKHADIHVYPRDQKEAGELFFHLSGMDICLKSSLEDGRFGGILIRALEREKKGDEPNKLFGGPLTCVNEILNTAKNHNDIQVVVYCNNSSHSANCIGKRKGINQYKTHTDEYWDKEYRFLRDDFNLGDEISMKDDTFDFKLHSIKKDRIRKYKIIND